MNDKQAKDEALCHLEWVWEIAEMFFVAGINEWGKGFENPDGVSNIPFLLEKMDEARKFLDARERQQDVAETKTGEAEGAACLDYKVGRFSHSLDAEDFLNEGARRGYTLVSMSAASASATGIGAEGLIDVYTVYVMQKTGQTTEETNDVL